METILQVLLILLLEFPRRGRRESIRPDGLVDIIGAVKLDIIGDVVWSTEPIGIRSPSLHPLRGAGKAEFAESAALKSVRNNGDCHDLIEPVRVYEEF